jgi:hypothetical protein
MQGKVIAPFKIHHETSFEELYNKSLRFLQSKQDKMEQEFGISKFEGWNYNHDEALFWFTEKGKPVLKIHYEVTGTWTEETQQWLWSWANPHISDLVTKEMIRIRKYGEFKDLSLLYLPRWKGDQTTAWAMTAISAMLLDAVGAYRIHLEEENIFCFVVFTRIERIN